MLHFYDFEVFYQDWLVVIINPTNQEKTVIVNDKKQLEKYYNKYKNDIWVGYNSRHYDQYILKGILLGFNPYDISDFIINKDKAGWQYSNLFNKIQLYNYDCMNRFASLKTLEAFMGNNIHETSVPFNIKRKLTIQELSETIEYCTHDVEQTIQVFLKTKREFDTHLNLITTFKLPLEWINKTQAQIIAGILGAQKTNYNDEFDVKFPDTLRLKKYLSIYGWYLSDKNRNYDNNLTIKISGVEHTFAWGGVHGAIPQFKYTCKDDEIMIMADVSSLYPSLMIRYNYFSRSIQDPQKYIDVYETNLKMKAENNPLRPAYKLICNTCYGCMKDKNNALYDPQNANNICIAGQLLLLDLIEKLEEIPNFKLIQSNTDGILVLIKRKHFELFDDIVYEWEKRTGLSMEFSYYKKCFQKDVNNYLVVDYNGKYKSKGAYVKKLNELDYDLPIVNKAMVEYMVNDVPVKETINNCDELIEFQKVFKLSSKYEFVVHNGSKHTNKSYRVFASNDWMDEPLMKCKSELATREKFANTPEHCFIQNGNIKGFKVPEKLDKEWYVDIAKERLSQFGVL